MFLGVLFLLSLGFDVQNGNASDEFIGRYWKDLPETKFPGYGVDLKWPGPRKLALRYYETECGKYVVALVERIEPTDMSRDLILAALDVRPDMKSGESCEFECDESGQAIIRHKYTTKKKAFSCNTSPSDECAIIGHTDPESVVIGMIVQIRERLALKYKPRRAWKIDAKSMKFTEVTASDVVCEPKN